LSLVELTDERWGAEKGVGEEPNHATAKKVWSSIKSFSSLIEGLDEEVHVTKNPYYI
jgi:hypothetical protein